MSVFCRFFEENTSYVCMKILRLNLAGQLIEKLGWQQALCLYKRHLAVWALGDVMREVRGDICRLSGRCSIIAVPRIITGGGLWPPRQVHRLIYSALFAYDARASMYGGRKPNNELLARDHMPPKSRGSDDRWKNVITACLRCNESYTRSHAGNSVDAAFWTSLSTEQC